MVIGLLASLFILVYFQSNEGKMANKLEHFYFGHTIFSMMGLKAEVCNINQEFGQETVPISAQLNSIK